jgi:hypothetical protein
MSTTQWAGTADSKNKCESFATEASVWREQTESLWGHILADTVTTHDPDTEWITRHNRGFHLGHQKDILWHFMHSRQYSAFYNLLKKTFPSFTSEKIKFEVGTAEQCLFIASDKTGKAVTYIVGYTYFTSPETVMGDGPLTIHLTSRRQKRNLIYTHYRHRRTCRANAYRLAWYAIGLG